MTDQDKQLLYEYLKSQRLMSLATYDEEVSSCTVYYAVDDELNLYFVSPEETEHVQNIKKNSQVAVTIADSHQLNSTDKVGVQIKGTAEQIVGLEVLKVVVKMWNAANPGAESVINLKNITEKVINSRFYKITPRGIKYFNEELYGDEEVKEFTL